MNLLNKNSKSINKNEFKRASFTEIIDKGDVSYFQGKPFTGIMYYHYKYDTYRNIQMILNHWYMNMKWLMD